jgi:hypothetical protein
MFMDLFLVKCFHTYLKNFHVFYKTSNKKAFTISFILFGEGHLLFKILMISKLFYCSPFILGENLCSPVSRSHFCPRIVIVLKIMASIFS